MYSFSSKCVFTFTPTHLACVKFLRSHLFMCLWMLFRSSPNKMILRFYLQALDCGTFFADEFISAALNSCALALPFRSGLFRLFHFNSDDWCLFLSLALSHLLRDFFSRVILLMYYGPHPWLCELPNPLTISSHLCASGSHGEGNEKVCMTLSKNHLLTLHWMRTEANI